MQVFISHAKNSMQAACPPDGRSWEGSALCGSAVHHSGQSNKSVGGFPGNPSSSSVLEGRSL